MQIVDVEVSDTEISPGENYCLARKQKTAFTLILARRDASTIKCSSYALVD